MDDRLSGRQAGAWGFCALTVPAVLTCAGLGWGWVLAGCAAAAVYYKITQALTKGAGYLPQLTKEAYGNVGGRLVLALGGVFALLAAAQTAAKAGLAFPDETAKIAGVCIIILAGLSNAKGPAQAGGVCGVLFLVLAGLYGVIFWSAAKSVRIPWLAPWGTKRQALEVIPAMLSLSCLRFLPRREKTKGSWLWLLVVIPAAAAAVTAGCLSPKLTQKLDVPFYTVSKSISVLGVMERVEPLVSAAMLLGFFALESLLLAAAREQIGQALEMKSGGGWLLAALCAAAFGLSFLTGEIPQTAFAWAAGVCWGFAPLLTQLIVAIK